MELNKIYNENCLVTMGNMPNDFLDLTITSPPYDDLRQYNGFHFDFEPVAKELYRVTKPGGVVVWNIGDSTVDGSETFSSLKQAIYFKEVCGFNAHDTMIWHKLNPMPQVKQPRYGQAFEYMFVFSKGKPSVFNPQMEPCKSAGQQYRDVKVGGRKDPERRVLDTAKTVPAERVMHNVVSWGHAARNYGHSAVFPEDLPRFHILSWSNVGNIVYDPFCGSGTTPAMALETHRNFIGSEISAEYCDTIKERLKQALKDKKLFDDFFID